MVVIVGFIIVIGAVLTGFVCSGGHIHSLIHPFEMVTIGGSALGAMIVMSPMKVLKDLVKSLIQVLKGAPFNKASYEELFKLMYELFRLARRSGFLALESHLAHPHDSAIFQKYPGIYKNHHVQEFICGLITPIMDGSVTPQRLPDLVNSELKAMEEEHHAPLGVLSKTADALPGFGIVAAVLGIVITMGAIDGPVEEIGHKVGAALVGTFLGILMSYGFLGPLATNMEFIGAAELMYFRSIGSIVVAFVSDLPPKVAIELARRGLTSDVKPTPDQLEAMFKAVEAAG